MRKRDLSDAPASPASRSRVGDAADELLGTAQTVETSKKAKKPEKSGVRTGRPPLAPEEKSPRVKLTHSVLPETRERIEELRHILRLDNKADVVDVAVRELAERHGVKKS